MPPVRVLVVGEDPLARSALVAALRTREDVDVAASLGAEEALPALESRPATILLWDLGVDSAPELDPLLAAVAGGASVVALVAHESAASDALAGGARGVLARTAAPARIAAALHAVDEGLSVIENGLADGALRGRGPAAAPLVEPLTAREREVLALLGQGHSNRQIAERLGISEHTAKFHVNAILGKLGAHTRAEAVALGMRLGLLAL